MAWVERTALKRVHTICKTDSGNLMYATGDTKLVLCDNLEGWGGEGGRRGVLEGGTHVCLWLIHADVWQRPSQYCN